MSRRQILFKRFFDICFASLGILLTLAPIYLLALLIKTTSSGPIFFRQLRVGRHGQLFKCIKFRSMYIGSEGSGTITTAEDTRITPTGRFLRRYKLDELPQLWNVLFGQMSFVGPRPDVPGYADRLQGEDRRILEMYPGITGPATLLFRDEELLLSGVNDVQRYNDEVIFPKKVRINLAYLDNWSFWKDLDYILMTVAPHGISSSLGIPRRLGFGPDPEVYPSNVGKPLTESRGRTESLS